MEWVKRETIGKTTRLEVNPKKVKESHGHNMLNKVLAQVRRRLYTSEKLLATKPWQHQYSKKIENTQKHIKQFSFADGDQSCHICYWPFAGEDPPGGVDDWNSHSPIKVQCGNDHVFGKSCLWQWLYGHERNKCPICRKELTGDPHSDEPLHWPDEIRALWYQLDEVEKEHSDILALKGRIEMRKWFPLSDEEWANIIANAFIRIDGAYWRHPEYVQSVVESGRIIMLGLTACFPKELVPRKIGKYAFKQPASIKEIAQWSQNRVLSVSRRLLGNMAEVLRLYDDFASANLESSGLEYWTSKELKSQIRLNSRFPLRLVRWELEAAAAIEVFRRNKKLRNRDLADFALNRAKELRNGINEQIFGVSVRRNIRRRDISMLLLNISFKLLELN